ncbi:MAG: carbamoyltransferase HypF [Oscillospiraceae bacterium]|nr:carbamoyltransferase HypF [Oscillospiraceae bacterium]
MSAATIARRIRVYGVVQGVGFRPTVSRHAAETGICGSVCNRGPYVEIFAQGETSRVAAFLDALEHRPPPRAAILKVDVKEAEIRPLAGFQIIESAKTGGEIFIPPDIAVCETCKAELFDPANRRYLHPFINCTCCGPRLTILDGLPYDRERTSMGAFPLCPDCAAEYHDPASRRYDAQPVCCPDCGPEVCLLGRTERGRAAITATRRTIRAGGIVAVKGIGGFHLCCDATNPEAVLLLRARKRRPRKPFAVMVRDMETAARECVFGAAEAEILDGHQKPILLLPRRADGKICPQTAPDNPRLGVMLPYAPVQLLLFDYDDGLQMPDCLVMTSGNESGAPICRDDAEARQALAPLCDCILSHNREIRIRADDTVMDFFQGQPYMIRRSRGWAPLPVWTSGGFRGQVLAVGGELKNCFCIGINELFYPSPYVGDLGDVRTAEALEETIWRFQTLLEAKPEAVACDLHPGYHSTALAREMGLPVVPVQHHYAHILSCMAENDSFAPTLGLSFDGTGYGTDGTIWGGELLECSLSGFERLGSVTPFLQAGGDQAAREGWRVAVGLIFGLYPERETALEKIAALSLCEAQMASVQLTMLARRINCVTSTSAGRLFDAVSAILGICTASTYEGEAATALQFAAQRYAAEHGVPEPPQTPSPPVSAADGRILMDTSALVRALIERRLAGEHAGALAWRFHAALAQLSADACVRARARCGRNTVALSGGVYQNTLLLELTEQALAREGFQTLRHRMIQPNDGGLALGQAVAAMAALRPAHAGAGK